MSFNGSPDAPSSVKAEVPLFLRKYSLSCQDEKLLNPLGGSFYVVLVSSTVGRASCPPGSLARRPGEGKL